MTTTRPPYQLELALPIPGRGEAPRRDAQEVEAVTATIEPKRPATTAHPMEAICDPDNIEAALRAVVRNKGAPGVDGSTVRRLPGTLKARWPEIEEQLLQGRYQPHPVHRVRIPKPGGGTRNLGIPTVIDRVIQQPGEPRMTDGRGGGAGRGSAGSPAHPGICSMAGCSRKAGKEPRKAASWNSLKRRTLHPLGSASKRAAGSPPGR